MKLNYFLRNRKAIQETPVRLIITWSDSTLVYPTKEKIKPALWNKNDQRARITTKFQHPSYGSSYEAFNKSLDKLEKAAKEVWSEWTRHETETISPDEFRELLDIKIGRRASGAKSLMEFIKEFAERGEDRMSEKTQAYVRYNTAKQFMQLHRLMVEYRRIKKIEFRDFETKRYKSTFQEFVKFMTDVKKYSNNTIASHIKNLKLVLNLAKEKNLLHTIDFKSFTYSWEEVETIALSPQELDAIHRLDLSARPALEKQRDLFIIGAWTALRYSDLVRIRPQHIEGDYIRINTVKTNQRVIIPIVPQTRAILEKYNYDLPQPISNQKYNDAIKEFTKLVPELNKQVEIKKTKAGQTLITNFPKWQLCSSHTCRRSACTNFYKMGIPASMIMAISGHATEKNFFKYIKITKEEAAEMMFEQLNRAMMKAV